MKHPIFTINDPEDPGTVIYESKPDVNLWKFMILGYGPDAETQYEAAVNSGAYDSYKRTAQFGEEIWGILERWGQGKNGSKKKPEWSESILRTYNRDVLETFIQNWRAWRDKLKMIEMELER